MKSETHGGLSSCSNFPERSTDSELAAIKLYLPNRSPEGQDVGQRIGLLEGRVESERRLFSKHKADVSCCNFVEHEIEI